MCEAKKHKSWNGPFQPSKRPDCWARLAGSREHSAKRLVRARQACVQIVLKRIGERWHEDSLPVSYDEVHPEYGVRCRKVRRSKAPCKQFCILYCLHSTWEWGSQRSVFLQSKEKQGDSNRVSSSGRVGIVSSRGCHGRFFFWNVKRFVKWAQKIEFQKLTEIPPQKEAFCSDQNALSPKV